MREMLKLGLILFLITSVAAFILGITNDVTQGIIQARLEEANIESIKALLPEAEEFNRLEDVTASGVTEVYEGVSGDAVVGYTVKTEQSGYGGNVVVIIGVGIDGNIAGVKIAEQTETPGLGSKITEPDFLDQFLSKTTAGELTVAKEATKDTDVQAISGATVSSTAVTAGVNKAITLFEDVLKNR